MELEDFVRLLKYEVDTDELIRQTADFALKSQSIPDRHQSHVLIAVLAVNDQKASLRPTSSYSFYRQVYEISSRTYPKEIKIGDYSKITLDKTIRNARQQCGLSQKDVYEMLIELADANRVNEYLVSRIENCMFDLKKPEYDWLIPALGTIFDLSVTWLELLRQQTDVYVPADLYR